MMTGLEIEGDARRRRCETQALYSLEGKSLDCL